MQYKAVDEAGWIALKFSCSRERAAKYIEQARRSVAIPRPEFIWFCDANNRVYEEGQSGPVWRKHWRKLRVVGETRTSWLTDKYWHVGRTQNRVPKNLAHSRYFSLTEAGIDDMAYIHDHAHKIAGAIHLINDAAILRQVADLIGYKPGNNPT
jgi:hypothetical protein